MLEFLIPAPLGDLVECVYGGGHLFKVVIVPHESVIKGTHKPNPAVNINESIKIHPFKLLEVPPENPGGIGDTSRNLKATETHSTRA